MQWFSKLCLPIVFILFSLNTYSQQLISKINSQKGFSSIIGYSVGGSLLLTYYNTPFAAIENFKCVIIDQEGQQFFLNIPELHKQFIWSIIDAGDSIRFYYFKSERKDNLINVLSLNKLNQNKKNLTIRLEIPGRAVGTFVENETPVIIWLDEISGQMKLIQVDGNRQIINEFDVSLDIEQLKPLRGIMINNYQVIRPEYIQAPLKFYRQNEFLYTSFESVVNYATTHIVYKMNLKTGSVTRWRLVGGSGEDFSSFISGDYFIRITKYRNFEINIYDINNGKQQYNLLIDKNSPFINEKTFIRNDMKSLVPRTKTVKNVLKENNGCFIAVYPVDSSKFVLKIGVHILVNPPVIIMPAVGLAANLILLAGNVAMMATSNLNYSHYFFLKGDLVKGFSYYSDNLLLENSIDEYEGANSSTPPKFSFKGYIDLKDRTYSIYKIKGAPQELQVVMFKK